jgi:hypothetical protein
MLTRATSQRQKLFYDCQFMAKLFVLAPRLLGLTTRDCFFNWTLAVIILTRGWVRLLRISFAFVKCTCRTCSMLLCYWKFVLVHIYQSSVSPGFTEQIISILLTLCYNSISVTWMVISLTTVKFRPLRFSLSVFALSYAANMLILMILYDFCLLTALFCYIIVYIWKVESCVQIAD